MKVKSSVAMSQLVAAGLLLLLTGCKTVEKHSLTYRLWDNGDLSNPSGKLTAQAVVPASGHPRLQQVFLDGKPYEQAMKGMTT
jgi:uncharacterized lipoprotein YmbA